MSKDVNRDSVNLHTFSKSKTNKSKAQNNISKKNNISTGNINNNFPGTDSDNFIDSSHKRLTRLRHAIGTGRFKIDPTRVAEKLIQFEIQLSA